MARKSRSVGCFCFTTFCVISLGVVGAGSAQASKAASPRIPEGRLFMSTCASHQDQDYAYCIDSDDGILGTALQETSRKTPPEIFSLAREDRLRQITDNHLFEFGSMVWSPDRSRFAISADRYGDTEDCRLYVVEVRTGRMTAVTPQAELACPFPADWSQDGWILMSAYFHDGPTQLYKVRPDGSGLQDLTCFWNEGQGAYDARWIQGGRSVVFKGDLSNKSGIYVISADGTNRRSLFEVRWRRRAPKHIGEVAVAPGRRRIAYVVYDGREETHRPDEVFVMRLDGSARRRLTFNARDETALSWSPNGDRLAIVEGSPYDAESRAAIRIIGMGSGSSVVIRSPAAGPIDRWTPPRWSPSGRYLAFDVSDGESSAVYTASVDGSWIRRATSFQRIVHLLDWRE
ncbi:MAG: hypothetical protein M3N53_02380 [Actinomycetota bacterium]|nr:hypothetical protein [Actinomycetota bacterium]